MDGPNQIPANQVSPEAYLAQMRERVDAALRRVAEAVNAAPDGAWINDSEWQVFEEFNDLRRDAYERALQMRADAAASTFSPGGPGEREAQGGQGPRAEEHADGQRPRQRHPHAVAQPRRGRGQPGGPAGG
jgi:hypothetical protein